jgi:hypothetical protein
MDQPQVITRKEALALGLKFFFTGKYCNNGHVSPQYVCDWKCVACVRNYTSSEAGLKSRREYKARNKSLVLEQHRNYNEQNKDTIRVKNREYAVLHQAESNARTKSRRAIQSNAQPGWFDSEKAKEFYIECQRATLHFGITHNVDHIVPIKSDFVCGLHWHGNMQILTQTENFSKGNRYWPDMSDTSDPELKALVKAFKAENKK